MSLHYRWQGDDVILKVVVKPGAKTSKIVGLYAGELKIQLAALPEKGKANIKLCEFLAECLKISKSQVKVLKGSASAHKEIALSQPGSHLLGEFLIKAK